MHGDTQCSNSCDGLVRWTGSNNQAAGISVESGINMGSHEQEVTAALRWPGTLDEGMQSIRKLWRDVPGLPTEPA